MNENKTPDWLLEIQNKSWEPEIIISGITLTFFFIFSDYIYNFYGMLVQDFAVYEAIAKNSYYVSIILLTGFKIVLIIHLILRGIWTGLVGLSYVFPNGVKKENLSKKYNHINYLKPETMVLNLEKTCSLLFSFIFTSITFVIGIFIVFVPVIMLFIIGLDLSYIRFITLYFIVPLVMILSILSIIFANKIKKISLMRKIESSFLTHTLVIYQTNIGKLKTYLIFAVYFLFILLISLSDISKFEFRNDKSAEICSSETIVCLNNNHYEDLKNQKLRTPKATIDQFRTTGNTMELFISFFKEDIFTVKKLESNPELFKKFNLDSTKTNINLIDLYKITIDDKTVSGLTWYITENIYTNQKRFKTTITLDSTKNGYHELRINKLFWSLKKEDIKIIKNWEIIPFETKNSISIEKKIY